MTGLANAPALAALVLPFMQKILNADARVLMFRWVRVFVFCMHVQRVIIAVAGAADGEHVPSFATSAYVSFRVDG